MNNFKEKKIHKIILCFILLIGIFFYITIFINNLNNFFEKKEATQKRFLNYEKQKLNNIFSLLNTYSNYINLRLKNTVTSNRINRYIEIQKILTELNLLAGQENYQINIYDQTNKNFFDGSSTNKLNLISDLELKKILTTEDKNSINETKKEIILTKKILSLDDFLIILRIPKNIILTHNKNYSIEITNSDNILQNQNNLPFRYLNKSFIINFSQNYIYNIKYIFIYFISPLIGIILFSVLMYKVILFFFAKHLQLLLEKINGEKVTTTNLYLDDIYQEILEKNEFILEKSKEIEKNFNDRIIGDFILGIIPYKEISEKLDLPPKIYCGILEIESNESNLDDYLFTIKKLIHKFESKDINLIFLEKEHIFILSKLPFIIEELSNELINFSEEELINTFGILSNKEISIQELPYKKIALEKLLIYKERMREFTLIEEETIHSLSFNCSYFYPINTEQKLISKIQNFDLNGALEIIENIFTVNFVEQNLSNDSIKRLKRIIVNGLEKIIIYLEIKDGFKDQQYFIKRELLSNEEFQNKTLSILKQICENYKSNKITEDSNESKMKAFIEENYNREVSLLEFAEYMNFTPQYLSNIYKKTFGENFNISLNRYRIQKSIELFIDHKGEIKIKELGEMVGYTNTITFINNFKKFKSVTPTSFFEKYLKTREKYLNS